MKAWVIRHGESEANQNGLLTGWLDVPLTEKGREEAALVRRLLAEVRFDKIYSSDLLRAKSTAEIALPGCAYETLPALREINVGSIAGQPLTVVRGNDIRSLTKEGYGAFGGESRAEFRDRVAAFMKTVEGEDHENVAVFAHAGVIRNFLDISLGIVHDRSKICCNNCAVAVFEYRNSNWRLYSWLNVQ